MSKRQRMVNDFTVPASMRSPRQCGKRGWFYIDPTHIEVYTVAGDPPIKITKRQLVAAIKVMDTFETASEQKP